MFKNYKEKWVTLYNNVTYNKCNLLIASCYSLLTLNTIDHY